MRITSLIRSLAVIMFAMLAGCQPADGPGAPAGGNQAPGETPEAGPETSPRVFRAPNVRVIDSFCS